jgi:hypothetical protein
MESPQLKQWRRLSSGEKRLFVLKNRRIGVKTKVNNTNGKDKDSHPKLVDGALKLEVLHVDSPDKVWVRLAHYKDMWTEFHHDLQAWWSMWTLRM